MSAKHTPGPWKIDYGYNRIINFIGPCVPDQYAGSSWLAVKEEDAILIAAAPDLLAALIAITTTRCDGMDITPINGAWDMATAAIAKATGQEEGQ